MSMEDRLHLLEDRLERIERKQDQHWESYMRLLNGIVRTLGRDIEKEAKEK